MSRHLWALQGSAEAPIFAAVTGEPIKYHVLEHNVLKPTR
jgi:hypothetical protein